MTEQICCRCEQTLLPSEQMCGGGYGGVVCKKHRSCISCWFDEDIILGKRNEEPDETKNVGFVNKPFRARDVKCPGCFNQLLPYILPVPLPVLVLKVDDDGIIDLT